ncbi:hypothetical protein PGB90_006178 [Kerria lacca]
MNLNSGKKSQLDPIFDVLGLTSTDPLTTFIEMWYQIFLWALFSSVVVHIIAAFISFGTLRKHHFGKFCPIFILCMGILTPMTSGVVSSAIIASVYKASMIKMAPLYAMFWGVGQTLLSAAVGFTLIIIL